MDTIMAFPLFVLAMGIVAALGNTLANIVYATAIINLPFYARMARAETNVRREAGYVEAARLAGNGAARAVAFHLMPNLLPPMMVQASLNMGWAILNAAGLSFIGLGVRPPNPEWGIMVSEGAAYIISGEWWVALFPGALSRYARGLLLQPAGRRAARPDRPEARMNVAVADAPLVEICGLSSASRDSAPGAGTASIQHDRRGETVGLVGESGSGKSLIAHTIAGILTPPPGDQRARRVRRPRSPRGRARPRVATTAGASCR